MTGILYEYCGEKKRTEIQFKRIIDYIPMILLITLFILKSSSKSLGNFWGTSAMLRIIIIHSIVTYCTIL